MTERRSAPSPHLPIRFSPSPSVMKVLTGIGILGGLIFLAGLIISPPRIWAGYLIAFNYVVGLGLAGGVFLAVLTLCNARWAEGLRRIPAAMTRVVPIAGLLGLILLLGLHSLYEWTHDSVVQNDAVIQGKTPYLNVTGFSLRLVGFFVLWIWMLRSLVRTAQPRIRDVATSRRETVISALFMMVFCVTFSFASFDWLMSLEVHWFSTIFALYRLAGIGLTGIAAVIILTVTLRRQGHLPSVTDSQMQDLGRVTLTLSVLWVYLWYCQYMLIWYTNLPEETSYYLARSETPWKELGITSLVLNWLIPFLVLLPRASCRSQTVLVRIAVVLMVGQALDLFLQVGPPLIGDQPVFGLWEFGPLVAAVALFFLVTLRGLSTPRITERSQGA